MTLRALQNPVRSARIVKHGGDTLTLEIESDRGRYRWDVRPVYRSQAEQVRNEFSRDWRTALKGLISKSIGVYPTRLNPERSKSGWTWTPHHSYRNVWHGNHREFAALVEKPWQGYWEWRVWKVRTAQEIASGLDETKQEAFRDVEKATRKRTRFLFNEKSKWKNIGGGEYARSFHGFHLRVKYGRVFRRYNWAIYWHGGTKAAADGLSDTFPGAKKAAEETAVARRTLFNPAEWLKGTDWQRHGSILQRRVHTGLLQVHRSERGSGYVWSYWEWLPKTDQYRELTFRRVSLRTEDDAKRDADKWYRKTRYSTPTLFNPGGWVDAGSMGYQREFPDKGLAVVRKMRAPQRGWTWKIYVWEGPLISTISSFLPRGRGSGLYGPVKAGWAKAVSKAKKDAEKAYRHASYKHPRTLFNTVRR